MPKLAGPYNAYWTPAKEREYEQSVREFDAMEECVEYLSMLLTEIDSLCDWPMYYDMLCAVATAKGEGCEEHE